MSKTNTISHNRQLINQTVEEQMTGRGKRQKKIKQERDNLVVVSKNVVL